MRQEIQNQCQDKNFGVSFSTAINKKKLKTFISKVKKVTFLLLKVLLKKSTSLDKISNHIPSL